MTQQTPDSVESGPAVNTLLSTIISKITTLETELKKLHASHEHTNRYLLEIIEEHEDRLVVLKYVTLTQKFRRFLSPRLGSLHQHPAIKLVIPDFYHTALPLQKKPIISIVTPSFNQEEFIEHTIQSVLSQNYPNLEYIIQDGGSNHQTIKIIEQHAANLKHWESRKDNGQAHALNLGFSHANGEIMAYLNSDDILLPGALNYVAHFFETHPEVDVIYSHRIVINRKGLEIGRWVLPPHSNKVLSWADFIPQETLFWRRNIWEKVGGVIDESFQFAMDWDLLLRFREAGAKFARVPRFLGAFRVHGAQKTLSLMQEKGIAEMNRLRERCHARPVQAAEMKRQIFFYIAKHIIYHKLYRFGLLKH